MPENSKKEKMGEVEEALLALPKEQLLKRCLKQITQAQRDLQQKDRLIADLSRDKEKTAAERERILQYAREEASAITAKSKREAEEMLSDAETKRDNAQIEADSIIRTALSQAREDIEGLERQRDDTKRSVISCFNNTVAECDSIISQLEGKLGELKDIRRTILEVNTIVENESFNRFDISDYVGVATDDETIVNPYEGIDDGLIDDDDDNDTGEKPSCEAEDYAALSVLLDEAVDESSPELEYEENNSSSGRVAEWISVPTIVPEETIEEDEFGECEFVDTQDDGEEDAVTFENQMDAEGFYDDSDEDNQDDVASDEYQEEYYESDASASFTESFMSLSDITDDGDFQYDENQMPDMQPYNDDSEEELYDPYADMQSMAFQQQNIPQTNPQGFSDFSDLEEPSATEPVLDIPDKKAEKVAAMQGRWLS